jgi:hypothetical protein
MYGETFLSKLISETSIWASCNTVVIVCRCDPNLNSHGKFYCSSRNTKPSRNEFDEFGTELYWRIGHMLLEGEIPMF